MPPQEPANPTALLIADLEHFGESLFRNEEVGEKRLNFFLTLLTAAIGGLVTLHSGKDNPLGHAALMQITEAVLFGLLLLGFMTYLRLLHRNRVTDQYQRTLKHIREQLLALSPSLVEYRVPAKGDGAAWKWFRGGLAETAGAMNAGLLCALLIINAVPAVCAVAASLLMLALFWALAAPRKGVS